MLQVLTKQLRCPNRNIQVCLRCSCFHSWFPVVQEKAKGDFKPEDEEFEDAQGNVYSKKTYDDLKRQGLI